MSKEAVSKSQKEGEVLKLIVKNRRASFEYEIIETYEAGLVLVGSEVKSLRLGRTELVDAWAQCDIKKGQTGGDVWLKQLYIAPFEMAKSFPHDPRRPRKLLLHKQEIAKISKEMKLGAYTLIPLELYFKKGRAKVKLGLVKGKNTVDKRRDIAKKTADRDARAELARRNKYS